MHRTCPTTNCVFAVILTIVTFISAANAQKKGGGSAPAAPAPASGAGQTSSNAPFEIQMLSYGALDQTLKKLAAYSCKLKPSPAYKKILILDPPAIQALQSYDSFFANAQALSAAFNTMTPSGGAGGGIDTFADITSAVVAAAVASTSESSFSFTLQDPSAAIVLLHQLQSINQCTQAYYAGVYTADQISGATLNGTPLTSVSQQLNDLAATRTAALRYVVGQAGANAGAGPCVSKGTAQDPCVAAFNSLDSTYNAFLAGLSAPNPTTGQPMISSVTQGYRLRAFLAKASEQEPVLAIYLSVAAAGGTQQVRKNLFTAIFTGDWIRYSGAVSLNVIVFQVAGAKSNVLFSNLLRYRTPLKQINGPGKYDDAANAGDNLDSVPK
ncbi:MAG TPA: hypothetical protein VIB39_17640 [Candidatus Angelobacter sp.]|jgi:hypothetical protein